MAVPGLVESVSEVFDEYLNRLHRFSIILNFILLSVQR